MFLSLKRNIKAYLVLFFYIVFIIASMIGVIPFESKNHNQGSTSDELILQEVNNDSLTTYTYVNTSNVITEAIDKGYAIKEQIKNENKQVIKETYYDADHQPVKLYNSFYGLSYEYKEHQNIMHYLDADGNIMALSTGCATVIRNLDENGRNVLEEYYDLNMQPVKCYGYYGISREYDSAGYCTSMTYLNQNHKLTNCSQGYATKIYKRDSEGIIVGEFYYDAHGNPAKSSLGEYGQLYVRDDQFRVIQITYVDQEGNPCSNHYGYSILKRTYYKDGTICTEMYYDANERPVSLKKGQYGIKRYNDCSLYLDKNGNIQYSIDNMLNGYPVLVIVCGCIVSILLLILPYNMSIALTILYVFFILYETLMFRESEDARYNLVLFSYADTFFQSRTIRVEVINNVWLFIPFGIGMYRIYQRKSIFASAFIFSILIETTQYITGLGVAEFNDVFENTLGGILGVIACIHLSQYNSK
ncbi:MAG: VanZ family protein [Bulleidia sp.]|nr:VanZ family protein [Bulleidia sp.]